MSSLEEEQLVQMVHDFIESETSTPTSNSPSQSLHLHQSTCLALQAVVARVTETEMEVLEDVFKWLAEMGSERKGGRVKERLMMGLRTDGYDASLCQFSGVASMCRLGGDYEYIDIVIMEADCRPTRLIVDIDFKSQFELARPTLSYTQTFNALPSIFVGNEEKLSKIVTLLSSAAKKSLTESGLHIPPWRQARYMHSKWKVCDHKISGPASTSNPQVGSEKELRTAASNWTPPKVERLRKNLGGPQRSCLSSQFSDRRINCC